MNREEFEQLTGIKVSFDFYSDFIEPLYAGSEHEKEEFCANWKKANKQHLITCVSSDFNSLDINVLIREVQEYNKVTASLAEFNTDKERLDAIITAQSKCIDELDDKIETLQNRLKELGKENYANSDKLFSYEMENVNLNQEIIHLKAMLFDYMFNKTA